MNRLTFVVCVAFFALTGLMIAQGVNVSNYHAQDGVWHVGGTLEIDSGGTVQFESGSTLDIQNGATFQNEVLVFNGATGVNEIRVPTNLADALSFEDSAGDLIVFDTTTGTQTITITPPTTFSASPTFSVGAVVSAGQTLDTPTVTNASLIVESLNPLQFNLNDVATFQIDNADITTFSAADDTNAQDTYIVAAAGGADTAVDGGSLGGALFIRSGDGSDGGADRNGGPAANVQINGGVGGDGGAHTSNNPDGAQGGHIGLFPGVGGSAGGGTGGDGANGALLLGGLVRYFSPGAPQVIDMADAAVTTTVDPATLAGTLLTSNFLAVDPNSAGASENLLLPPEADVSGVYFVIANTGGESIAVQNDAGGAIITIATTEWGIVFLDSASAWQGKNF